MTDGVKAVVGILVALVAFGVFVTVLSSNSVLGNAALGSFSGVSALLGLLPLVMVGGLLAVGGMWLYNKTKGRM